MSFGRILQNAGISRRLFKRALAVFVVAVGGAAVAGVLVARHQAAQAFDERAPRFESLSELVPFYPGTRFYPMGESVAVAGVSRELGYAVTHDPIQKVGDRYDAIWQSQGFKVDRRATDDQEWVSASDPSDPWVRSILATRNGQETVIVATVRDLSRPSTPPLVPIPAVCTTLSDDAARDAGVHTQELLLECRAKVDEILDYYDGALHGSNRRDRLGADGSAGNAFVTYTEERREVRLMAKEGEPGADGQPRTAVSITWQEGR